MDNPNVRITFTVHDYTAGRDLVNSFLSTPVKAGEFLDQHNIPHNLRRRSITLETHNKVETLWGKPLPGPDGIVFAKWGNGSFYPGVVTNRKGLGGNWIVKFDDGDESAVPASQIIPMMVIGSGTVVNYDDETRTNRSPNNATVVTQKLELDESGTQRTEMYQLRLVPKQPSKKTIWVYRRQIFFDKINGQTILQDYLHNILARKNADERLKAIADFKVKYGNFWPLIQEVRNDDEDIRMD